MLNFGQSWNLGFNCIRVRLVPLLRVNIRLGSIQSPIKRIVQALYQNRSSRNVDWQLSIYVYVKNAGRYVFTTQFVGMLWWLIKYWINLLLTSLFFVNPIEVIRILLRQTTMCFFNTNDYGLLWTKRNLNGSLIIIISILRQLQFRLILNNQEEFDKTQETPNSLRTERRCLKYLCLSLNFSDLLTVATL
jgi:hypothetical protein